MQMRGAYKYVYYSTTSYMSESWGFYRFMVCNSTFNNISLLYSPLQKITASYCIIDYACLVWLLGLWCLTPLSRYLSYIVVVSFMWRKPEYPEKTTDLSQVTDKLYHIMLHRVHLAMNRVRTHNGT